MAGSTVALGHLRFQRFDFAAQRVNFGILGLGIAASGNQRRRRLLEHRQITLGNLRQRIRAQRPFQRAAELLLVLAKRRHRRLKILRHHGLHIVAIHTDQLAQEIQRLFPDGFLFQDLMVPHPDLARIVGPVIATVRIVSIHMSK